MKKNDDIRTYTAEELKAMHARGESATDWLRLDAMTEKELEAAITADEDWKDVPADWHARAKLYGPRGTKAQVTLRLDPDILDWFKKQGQGYQTRINAVLRSFVESQK